MTHTELIQRIAETHNRIAHVRVSGDDTILIADTLRDLRAIVSELQIEPVCASATQDGPTVKPIRKASKSAGSEWDD